MADCLHCDNWGCNRCTRTHPYSPERGIDAPTVEELELERLRAEVKRLSTVCCPTCGTEIERSTTS